MNSSYNVLINQTQNSKPSQYTSSDLYLLAKTIYAESRGEPYTGQVAVGAVILNRVRSSQFPNTVSGRSLSEARFHGRFGRSDQPDPR